MLKFASFILLALATPSLEQGNTAESPCPEVFMYESTGSDPGQWYGVARLPNGSILHSLNIILDGRADRLENWVGVVNTDNNIDFQIMNPDTGISPDPIISVRFFVQFNPLTKTPRVQTIKLNGRDICNAENAFVTRRPPSSIPKPRPIVQNNVEPSCKQDPSSKECESKKCNTQWVEGNATGTYIYRCCDSCHISLLCNDVEKKEILNDIGIFTLRPDCSMKTIDFLINTKHINTSIMTNSSNDDLKSIIEEPKINENVSEYHSGTIDAGIFKKIEEKPDDDLQDVLDVVNTGTNTKHIKNSTSQDTYLVETTKNNNKTEETTDSDLQDIVNAVSSPEPNESQKKSEDNKIRDVIVNRISVSAPVPNDFYSIYRDLSTIQKQLDKLEENLANGVSFKNEHYYVMIYVIVGVIVVSCLLCCMCRSPVARPICENTWPMPCKQCKERSKFNNKEKTTDTLKSIDELEMNKSYNVYSIPMPNGRADVPDSSALPSQQIGDSSPSYLSLCTVDENCTRI